MCLVNPLTANHSLGKANGSTASNQHTPSQHRTELGLRTEPHLQNCVSRVAPGMSHLPTPSQRLPLGTMGPNSLNRPNVGVYGMSAGLKVGRQQGKPI